MVESRNSGSISSLAEGAANKPSVHAQYSQSPEQEAWKEFWFWPENKNRIKTPVNLRFVFEKKEELRAEWSAVCCFM